MGRRRGEEGPAQRGWTRRRSVEDALPEGGELADGGRLPVLLHCSGPRGITEWAEITPDNQRGHQTAHTVEVVTRKWVDLPERAQILGRGLVHRYTGERGSCWVEMPDAGLMVLEALAAYEGRLQPPWGALVVAGVVGNQGGKEACRGLGKPWGEDRIL